MLYKTIEDWQSEVEITYFSHTRSLPLIHRGKNPYEDIEVVRRLGIGRIHWFYYSLESVTEDFWNLFLVHFLYEGVFETQLTTALDLSNRLGIPIQERNIPNLWLLSIEKSISS